MPDLSAVLKNEITRLARKEVKGVVDPLRKASAGYRREIADLKRQVALLQRDIKAANNTQPATEAEGGAVKSHTRFSASALKSQRARLGLSASDFGRLVGAGGQSVYNWEAGKAVPREAQKSAIAAVRALGKREAAKRLEGLAGK